jgi:DNA polymerase-3 subunit delta
MIYKSYEINKNKNNFLNYNFFLLYGENIGLKKDFREIFKNELKKKDSNLETLSFYENEIIDNTEDFYNSIYSGSLFGDKKLITIFDSSDKIFEDISDIYEKHSKDVFIIILSDVLEKKSKLRNFFEKSKKTVCIPCYLDSERDLENIATVELKKNNITLSRETINLLVTKSNSDRNNLKNEIEKIISYSLNKKKIDFGDINSLINLSGDFKSDALINECLSGDILQYKKIISELYANTLNQIFLLRILSNKVQRLLKIKKETIGTNNLDNIINTSKPPIFWKEKPIVKKQLSIWSLDDLRKIIDQINNTELLCKKNPLAAKAIFYKFFLDVCVKANSYS